MLTTIGWIVRNEVLKLIFCHFRIILLNASNNRLASPIGPINSVAARLQCREILSARIAQSVERIHGKDEVISSILIAGSSLNARSH